MAAHLSSRGAPRSRDFFSSPCVRVRAQVAAAGSGMPSNPTNLRSTNLSPKSSSSSPPVLCARIARFLSAPSSSDLPPRMYSRALSLCREQDYERAFAVFERVVCLQPENSKAWVSWAQAEKRATRSDSGRSTSGENSGGGGSGGASSSPLPPSQAVAVLQAGLSLNRGGPPSATAPLAQAWALLELQRGNARAAVALLARAVREDPERCSPVLRWAPVIEAAREAAAAEEGRTRRKKGRSEGGGFAAAAADPLSRA